ncbi:hypothetical protein F5146DRAFT_1034838 [Armillaria mellea]|nr:hypothetical protein F5146DRAFT_1034838 [Armillaria mellea]
MRQPLHCLILLIVQRFHRVGSLESTARLSTRHPALVSMRKLSTASVTVSNIFQRGRINGHRVELKAQLDS